ncbi:hypothetical protein [Oceanobacillus sp. FSL H7-0719]|uniref:hypothetical protein n=1 Tax=Oceanobacillus sp. FSL H7-0719 TaxID=2954507 RepID=UPI0032568539
MALQFGIKEVLNLLMRDYATGKPITFIDYAQASSNEFAAENLEIRGGHGNALLMTFDHSKSATMTLTLPLVDLHLLALLGGTELEEATKDILRTEKKILRADGVTLDKNPIGDVTAYEVESGYGFGEKIENVTVEGKKVTLTGVEAGTEVYLLYQHAIPTTSKKLTIRSNAFPKAVSMTGYGLARDRNDQLDKPVQVEVHQARPQSNFTFNMSGTEATNLELTFNIMEFTDENGRKGYIDYTFIDEEDGTIDQEEGNDGDGGTP